MIVIKKCLHFDEGFSACSSFLNKDAKICNQATFTIGEILQKMGKIDKQF